MNNPILPIVLRLKPYKHTGVFLIPTILIKHKFLFINKKYKVIIEEVEDEH